MQSDPAEHGDCPHIGAHLPAAAGALRLRVAVPRRLHPHPLLLHRRLHVHVPREPTRLRTGEILAGILHILFACGSYAPNVVSYESSNLRSGSDDWYNPPITIVSQVAYVVKKNGLLSKRQNILVGYGIPLGVVLVSMALNLYGYGGWCEQLTDLDCQCEVF